MKHDPFASALVRKSERAIRSAYLSLQDGDPDTAVNRAYYAMFNIARAALLSAGVSEGDLPRTHRGLIEAFRTHAVQTGRVDPEMASSLSRTESLRLKADYTGTEIDANLAKGAVTHAEAFVQSVEKAFGLESLSRQSTREAVTERPSMEEVRRKAAENWRRNFVDKPVEHPGTESADSREETPDTGKTDRERDTGYERDPES